MALAVATAGIVTVAALLYAPLASFARAHENQTPGLDAAAYLDDSTPNVAAAAEWVRGNLDADEHVVLQGLVQSYRGGNLISVHSGVPTVLQWPGHELTWRGESASLGERIAAIDRIYGEGTTRGDADARSPLRRDAPLPERDRAPYLRDLISTPASRPGLRCSKPERSASSSCRPRTARRCAVSDRSVSNRSARVDLTASRWSCSRSW